MTRAIYGVAGALALVVAPAWAGDAEAEETARMKALAETPNEAPDAALARPMDEVVSQASLPRASAIRTTVMKGASEGGTGSAAPADGDDVETNSVDPSLPASQRWLHEREGYRDGGY